LAISLLHSLVKSSLEQISSDLRLTMNSEEGGEEMFITFVKYSGFNRTRLSLGCASVR